MPPGSVTVSLLPDTTLSVPAPVNAPYAITLDVFEVATWTRSWKCSVWVAAPWLLARASPVPPMAAATAALPMAAMMLLRIARSFPRMPPRRGCGAS